MLIDRDGVRIGRYDSERVEWAVGDEISYDGRTWRIVELLPEVSTMVSYVGVWVIDEV